VCPGGGAVLGLGRVHPAEAGEAVKELAREHEQGAAAGRGRLVVA
jgi:hypothetical protein